MHYITSKSLLSQKNGINIFRGCEHGCIYCDSRSTCYGMDHPFEDIAVKQNAPILLEEALKRKRKKCIIGTGSMTDPYTLSEKKLKMTRKCLELIDSYGFGLSLITKSDMVLRDIDLISSINEKSKATIAMTLTTADSALCRIIEPRAAVSEERCKVLNRLKKENIGRVVWLCPFLPFINDTKENLNTLLDYCFEAQVSGIICFGIGLTLRDGNREYFYDKLDEHFPSLKERYIKTYGNAYNIVSKNNDELMRIFHERCARYKVETNINRIFTSIAQMPEKKEYEQLRLF